MAKGKIDKNGDQRIQCKICGEWFHRLDVHLKAHGTNVKEYTKKYPGEPTISASASAKAASAQQQAQVRQQLQQDAKPATTPTDSAHTFKIGVARLQMRTDSELDGVDKARVPQHDIHYIPGARELEQWQFMALGVMTKTPVFIFGPTGCGKTTGVRELGAALNQPVRRIQMSKDWDLDMFLGHWDRVPDPDNAGQQKTVWVDGVFTEAVRKGWWMLIDELDAAPPDILMTLQGVLEDGVLVLPTGEVIEPKEHGHIFATGNTNGRGDESGLYAGTHVLNEATLDRFGVVIKAQYPDKPTEIKILVDRTGIEADVAGKMVEIATKVREALEQEACGCTFSTRRLIRWAGATQLLGDVRSASKITVTNKLTGDDARFVDGLVQRYFGGQV